MLVLISKSYTIKYMYITISCLKILKRNYIKNHPYKHIHPWKSLSQFTDDLLNNIIYNKDGLVALNKPYGIRRRIFESEINETGNNVPYGVNYTLEDALPYIATQLNYPNLTVVKCPEMYMSGIALLAANSRVHRNIELSYSNCKYPVNTYWIITVGIPKQLKSEFHLAVKAISNSQFKERKLVLTTSWSQNDKKLRRVKLMKGEYKVLSNSTLNLCSLIELKSSTHNKSTIRLFAATMLYSPILGDNIYASRIQKVGNTYVRADPFFSCPGLPKLDTKLLKLLVVKPSEQAIIPTHIHLKSINLPNFFGRTLTIESPIMPYFDWSCKQLEFKHLMSTMDKACSIV
ncbi:mitochondrial RNA pseudouridine synthase rpusd4-like [Frieseomelitta varia]|uniref:mitochondrial RNA pseudouridine synthase rpusd4-like n=1 Tax=Frieseomelitta varia TaxID=561572 RepID=UPI001CB6A231|nr:mitochondrial RNA pseudouridine synthase rpusd4-like [Frieseomelitta varia]